MEIPFPKTEYLYIEKKESTAAADIQLISSCLNIAASTSSSTLLWVVYDIFDTNKVFLFHL